MLKYKPEELQNALMYCIPSKLVQTLKDNQVNPKSIWQIVVFDHYAILAISEKYYAAVSSLNSGYSGAGPSAFVELLQWCGCDDQDIFTAIKQKNPIHLMRIKGSWSLCQHEIKDIRPKRERRGKTRYFI